MSCTMVEWVDQSNNVRSIMTALSDVLLTTVVTRQVCSMVDGTRPSEVWGDSQLCSVACRTRSA